MEKGSSIFVNSWVNERELLLADDDLPPNVARISGVHDRVRGLIILEVHE